MHMTDLIEKKKRGQTLSDEEIRTAMETIIGALEKNGAPLRR